MPHEHSPVYAAGVHLEEANAALVLLHGRGATAEDILSLSGHLAQPGLAYLAPQAEGYTWYPNRFIFPVEQNEPHLSAALALVDRIVVHVQSAGIAPERIFIGGFSQGACLASEYVIRNPRRYGGLLVFSGGYIGPLNQVRKPEGNLQGMPAFVGCSDVDPYIPLQRVQETASLLTALGAQVTERIYPDMDHTNNDEELALAQEILSKAL